MPFGLIGHSGPELAPVLGGLLRGLSTLRIAQPRRAARIAVSATSQRSHGGFLRSLARLIAALMPAQPTVWTLEQVEAATAELSLGPLLARYRECVAGGRVWRRFDSQHVGADYCAWCLRVRLAGGFEGWTVAPRVPG